MNLAIVGSRDFKQDKIFNEVIDQFITEIGTPNLIVSGGATGADTLAEIYAKEKKIETKIFLPDWKKYGKSAGPLRNKQIVTEATHLIAFRTSVNSIGTNNSIKLATNKEIPIWVVDLKKEGYEIKKID
jgi:hypothetical protein